MKILAIDTSTRTLCAGLSDGKKDYEYGVDYATRMSKCLAPSVERMLGAAGLEVKDIDCLACGAGPGSFTGIRIGMAFIKGLAWGAGKPVVAVPSIDIVALNAAGEEGSAIACVLDARRGMVYAALYRSRKGRLSRISPYRLVSPRGLLEELERRAGKKGEVVFCGDGIPVVREIAGQRPNCRYLDADYWKPQGRHLLWLAGEKARRGEFADALSLKPLYLYPKECQIRK